MRTYPHIGAWYRSRTRRRPRRRATRLRPARRLGPKSARREPPEARLVREHAHEPMPELDLVDVPVTLSATGLDQPTWLEEALGERLPTTPVAGGGYGRPLVAGDVAIAARAGLRAAVAEVKPGLYVVGTVPEAMVRPEVGVAPLVIPLLTAVYKAVEKPIANAVRKGRERREAEARAKALAKPQPQVVHVTPDEVDKAEPATAGCGCGCRTCHTGWPQ